MTAQRTGLEVTLTVIVGVTLLLRSAVLRRKRVGGDGTPESGRSGIFIRLHGSSKGSAAVAFAAMEEIFSPSASQARQVLQEQKRMAHRAPTPGDWLDDGPSVTGRFARKLTVSVSRPQTADAPDERHVIASHD